MHYFKSYRFLKLLTLGYLLFTITHCCNDDKTETDEDETETDTNTDTPSTICENGFAGIYPCNGYDLISNIPLTTFEATSGNDSWGWTDPTTGNEYVIMCLNNGTVFIDITEPAEPVYLGKLPTASVSSSWRDAKVYNNHAFIVADNAPGHGMQIFDLTRLRLVTDPPVIFTSDAHFTGFGSAHNIVINETSGYAYVVGTSRAGTYAGGPLFINIQDPKNPIDEGGFGAGGYSHDAQVVTYSGPDTDYTDQEILISSNENEVVIADVSNKANPVSISTISYSNVGYTHQGWFTEDMTYFILGDELDEQALGHDTRTIIFDFTDLDNPVIHMQYFGPTAAIDHNGYVKGDTFYQANYTAGVRMIDISDIENSTLTETGFFDTYPSNNSASFNGAWNVYPYFSSENIVISDINSGLFIIRKSGT